MTKSELRVIAKEKLKNINDREGQNARIYRRVTDCPFFHCVKTVFVFVGVGDEPDTIPIIQYALDLRKVVCVPKILDDGTMVPVILKSLDQLKPGKFGIPTVPDGEVIDYKYPDTAVVPGLAFTKRGTRLGRGGGYYDKLLSQLYTFNIGICFEEQIMEEIPREKHDERMSLVFTGEQFED